MKSSKFLSSLLITSLGVSYFPTFISCAESESYTLTLYGGDTAILIDQSNSSNIIGTSFNPWKVSLNNIDLASTSVVWELVDCNDPHISIDNGYIKWLNPSLKNSTFRVKATFLSESTGKTISAISDEIHFYADSNAMKVEFINEDYLAHTINADAGIDGQQNYPWVLKINGEPYTGLKTPWKLVNSLGKEIKGISLNSSNQILWDSSINAGYSELYLVTDIVDSKTSKSYTVCSSNNPIKLTVGKAKVKLDGGENHCYSPAGVETTIGNWKAFNFNNQDITTSSSTIWQIQNTGQEFGDNITIDYGKVIVKKSLPIGKYTFNVIATDLSQEKTPSAIWKNVELTCYSQLVVHGGATKFVSEKGKEGFVAQPWSLYSGKTALEDVNFSITHSYKPDEEKIKELATHIQFTDSPFLQNGISKFLVWDSSVLEGNYTFKIKCVKDDIVAYSDDINFMVVDPSKPCISLSGGSNTITAIKSTKKTNSQIINCEQNDVFDGKLNNPFVVTLYNGQIIDRELLTYTITHTLNGSQNESKVKFWVDQENCLCWSGLDTMEQSSSTIGEIKIKVDYKYNGEVLTDVKNIEFNILLLSDDYVLHRDGLSYNFSGNTDYDDMKTDFYFPDNNQKYNLSYGVSKVQWTQPIIDPKSKDCDLLLYNKKIRGWTTPAVQYQPLVLNITIPSFSEIAFNLHIKSIFEYSFPTHDSNNNGENTTWRLQLFDFGIKKQLPTKINACKNEVFDDPHAKESTFYDKHFNSHGGFIEKVYGENISSEYEWKDIPVKFQNDTNTPKTFQYFLGVSSVIGRGVSCDVNTCCRFRFNVNNLIFTKTNN